MTAICAALCRPISLIQSGIVKIMPCRVYYNRNKNYGSDLKNETIMF